MDHYKTLGLSHSATKEEIKEAFRRCALKFHPDRHSQSTKEVRDGASLKFKQVSEAYEVLTDDRKRADYDFKRRSSPSSSFHSNSNYYGGRGYGYGGGSTYKAAAQSSGGGGGFDFRIVFGYITRRGFLVNLALASALLGGTIVIERSVQTVWRMNNAGKSFEETIQSIENSKTIPKENN